MSKALNDLITDWGGFERFVADLHATGNVTVQHDVVLIGRSGAPRQIDVLVTHTTDLYEHRILVECKYWSSNVSRLHVDALANAVRDLNAAKGVIFTARGFESGAETQAQADGIDLFVVRELTDEEWGLPGPVVDLVLQVWQRTVFDVKLEGVALVDGGSVPPSALPAMRLDDDGVTSTCTPTLDADGRELRSLEERIATGSALALQRFTAPSFLINGGAPGTRYMQGGVNLEPPGGFLVRGPAGLVRIRRVSLQLGMKVKQSRITSDRRDAFVFALAVQNCVTSQVTAAARAKADPNRTVLHPLGGETKPEGRDPNAGPTSCGITRSGNQRGSTWRCPPLLPSA